MQPDRSRPTVRFAFSVFLVLLGFGLASAQSNELRLPDRVVDGNSAIAVPLIVTLEHIAPGGLGGFSFGIETDAPTTISAAQYVGPPADFQSVELVAADGLTAGVIFSAQATTIAAGTYEVLTLTCDASALVAGGTSVVEFRGDLGSPPAAIEYATPGGAVSPATVDGTITRSVDPPPSSIGANLWVTHELSGEVARFDTLSELLTTLTSPPGGSGGTVAVAVGDDGSAWVADSTLGRLIRYAANGPITTTDLEVVVNGSPGAVAIGPSGNVWYTDGPALSLGKVSPAGAVLLGPGGSVGPAITFSSAPGSIAVDRLGFVWVLLFSDRLLKVSPTGETLLDIALPNFGDPTDVAIDREGFVWVVLRAENEVRRFSSGGSLVGTWSLSPGFNPDRIVIRRDPTLPGLREAYVSPAPLFGGTGLERLRFPVGTVDSIVTPAASGIAVDGRGRIWLTEQFSDFVYRYDPISGLTDMISQASGFGAVIAGDATGSVRANVLFPFADPNDPRTDLDGDGFANGVELDAGSDPFTALSTPPGTVIGFVDPVVGLSCSVDSSTVTLSWGAGNPPIDSFEVRRVDDLGVETVLAAALPATTTNFADNGLPGGTFRYRVRATSGVEASEPQECVATIGPGQLVSSRQVFLEEAPASLFDLTRVPTADPSDPDEIVFYATEPGSDRIIAMNGQYEIRQLITDPLDGISSTIRGIAYDPDGDGQAGSLLLAAGGEGEQVRIVEINKAGDLVLAQWDLTVNTSPLLGTPGALAYSRNGEYLLVIGPVGCDIFALARSSLGEIDGNLSFSHPQLSTSGFALDGIDIPPGESFGASGGSLALLSAEPATSPTVEQEFAVTSYTVTPLTGSPPTVNEIDSIPLTVIEQENSLGGFAFGPETIDIVGLTTESLHEILIIDSPQFIRSDCNHDGATNIADPILHLGILFGGDPQTPCLDACDSNGSGTLDIADPITTLGFLFASDPPPPAPFPGCGTDPAGAPIGCPDFAPCP